MSNGGIEAPWPEDHYSNPPTMSFYHLLDLVLYLIDPLALNLHSGDVPSLR